MNGDHKLYLYQQSVDIVIDSMAGLNVDNRPMNNKRLVAHRGLSNEIVFNIRNRDRKLQNVNSDELRATLIAPVSGKRLMTRLLEHTGTTGQVKLTMLEGDLVNLNPGLYQIFIGRQTPEGTELPVFSDHNDNIVFDIDVRDQTKKSPVETQTANVSQFMQVTNTNNGDGANVFVTSALKGNHDKNFFSAFHSVAIYPDTYTGRIDIQASCVDELPSTANNSTDWFTVKGNINLTSNSAIYYTSFTVNANYIRIMSQPTAGNISLVNLRN